MVNPNSQFAPESKSIFASKQFWLALLSPLVGWAASKYLVGLSAEAVSAVTEALAMLAVGTIGTRFATSQPVHLIPPKQ